MALKILEKAEEEDASESLFRLRYPFKSQTKWVGMWKGILFSKIFFPNSDLGFPLEAFHFEMEKHKGQ